MVIVDREYQLRRRWPFPVSYYLTIRDLAAVWRRLASGSIIIIDEFDRRLAESSEDRRVGLDLVNLIRPWGCQLWLTARRTAEVPRSVTGNARHIYWGRTVEPLDLQYAAEYGFPAARLPGLQRGHFLHKQTY